MTNYATVREYASHRRVARSTVYLYMSAGLPYVQQGAVRRINVSVADAWLDAGNLTAATTVAAGGAS